MGIGGSGMSSIAKYLKQKGHDVEGYDQRISYITNLLESDGVKTCQNLDNLTYQEDVLYIICLLYTSPSPRDWMVSRMPSSA